MKNISAVLLFLVAGLSACQSPKEKALKEIDALQSQDTVFSLDNMAKLKDAYIAFADKYPDDEHSPEYLFKAAQSCSVLAAQNNDSKKHHEAISIFERVKKDYPKHEMAIEGMFLTGYIYENHLGDTSKAKEVYRNFVATYPESELAEEAEMAIKNMSIPLEQIIGVKKDTVK